MTRKYKFYNKQGQYFVSFATVYWIDVFVRETYFEKAIESLKYCRDKLGLEIYCWCPDSYRDAKPYTFNTKSKR